MNRIKFVSLFALMALLVVALAPASTQAAPPGDQTIVEIAASNPDFSILVAAVQAAGLVDTLNGNRHYTVFAPTNAAFEELLADLGISAEELLANKPLLTDVLLYHVTRGDRNSQSVLPVRQIKMLNGDFTYPSRAGTINNANIIAADINASNGVIHVIDTVLLPPQ